MPTPKAAPPPPKPAANPKQPKPVDSNNRQPANGGTAQAHPVQPRRAEPVRPDDSNDDLDRSRAGSHLSPPKRNVIAAKPKAATAKPKAATAQSKATAQPKRKPVRYRLNGRSAVPIGHHSHNNSSLWNSLEKKLSNAGHGVEHAAQKTLNVIGGKEVHKISVWATDAQAISLMLAFESGLTGDELAAVILLGAAGVAGTVGDAADLGIALHDRSRASIETLLLDAANLRAANELNALLKLERKRRGESFTTEPGLLQKLIRNEEKTLVERTLEQTTEIARAKLDGELDDRSGNAKRHPTQPESAHSSDQQPVKGPPPKFPQIGQKLSREILSGQDSPAVRRDMMLFGRKVVQFDRDYAHWAGQPLTKRDV